MKRYNHKFMEKAYSDACNSKLICKVRISAVLVHDNSVIAAKTNQYKTHPFQKKYSKNDNCIFLHAETHCVITALRTGFNIHHLKHSSLYIARAAFPKKGFVYADARPCDGCMSCLCDFKIRNVFYTTNEGNIECL